MQISEERSSKPSKWQVQTPRQGATGQVGFWKMAVWLDGTRRAVEVPGARRVGGLGGCCGTLGLCLQAS